MRKTNATNPELLKLITLLKKQSKEKGVGIWLDVAEDLAKPSRKRTAINLSKLNRVTDKNAIIIVPGKILAAGSLDHAVTVAAFNASDKAKAKLAAVKAKYLSIPELLESNPTGSNVQIIG
jgi:large subunit ribosomal protein L18e